MSDLKSALLPDRGVVGVSGPDAFSLLQGVITNDMGLLDSREAIHTGLLSPQGKILFDFFVVRADNGYLLDVAREQTSALVQRLSMYKLRAQCNIADMSKDYTVVAMWGGALPEKSSATGATCFEDPRLADMGARMLVTLASDWMPFELGAVAATHEHYDSHRISLGVPEGGKDYAFGGGFPHDALFDQLNGVSFTKGCYVGQEVVSRMQHRGTARRRIVPITAEVPLPASGTQITAGTASVGTLGSTSGSTGLANLRIDRVGEVLSAGEKLMAGDVPVGIAIANWTDVALEPEGRASEVRDGPK